MSESDRLIEAQIPGLRRYARALLRDNVMADDLVQDTLERAWGRLHLWRRGSDLRAWLFTIMHNLFVNQLKTAAGQRALMPLDDEALEVPVRATQEDNLSMRDLSAALGQLPVEYREVLLLIGLEQMRYEEVAKVLNIPVGTVMSRLSRGRERLRALLAGGVTTASLRRVK